MLESRFARLLSGDNFVVTSELSPPRGANHALLLEKVDLMKEYCDAVNITDNVRGIPSMSSVVSSYLVSQVGIEPIMHLTTRDRNRIAIESELYGAYALGIRNILFVSGDHVFLGSHHQAETVYDVNSIQALKIASDMMSGYNYAGDELEGIPHFFLGASFNHNADSLEEEASRVEKKMESGAQFFQSQAIFDTDRFGDFLKHIENLPIKILGGIIPLKSPDTAEFMHHLIPGIEVPPDIIERIRSAGNGYSEEAAIEIYQQAGLEISLELIEKLQSIKRIDGIHIMGVGWEESLAFLVRHSGLLPRPQVR